jgi:hypothetical protein
MKCPNCGNELSDEAKFCVECGIPITEAVEAVSQKTEEIEPAANVGQEEITESDSSPKEKSMGTQETAVLSEENTESVLSEKKDNAPEQTASSASEPRKEPVTVVSGTDSRLLLTSAQYFFLILLFHIPVIGLIFLFVWGLGRPRNLSLKRFSLAVLILRLIGWLIMLLCTVAVLLGVSGVIPGFTFQFGSLSWIH